MSNALHSTRDRRDDLVYLLTRLDEQIRIELDLVGQRMNVLAVSQAFLFSAYTTDLGVPDRFRDLRTILVWSLPCLGLGICMIVGPSLEAALHVVHQRKCEREIIRDRLRDDLESSTLPPSLFGSRRVVILDHVSPDKWQHFWGNVPYRFLAPLIAIVWVALLAWPKK